MARVRPKFTLFPDDPEAGLQKDRIEQRPLEYHERVRRNYLAQAKADPARYRVIDASREPEAVHEDVWNVVGEFANRTGKEMPLPSDQHESPAVRPLEYWRTRPAAGGGGRQAGPGACWSS